MHATPNKHIVVELFYIRPLKQKLFGEHTQSYKPTTTWTKEMAAKPGILTDWPWAGLGNFKVYSSYYHFMVKKLQGRSYENQ